MYEVLLCANAQCTWRLVCIFQEWSFFFYQSCGFLIFKPQWASKPNSPVFFPQFLTVRLSWSDIFMCEHPYLGCVGLIFFFFFFGVRAGFSMDDCCLFPWCMLAVIFLIGVEWCDDQSLHWILSGASHLLPCYWSRGPQICFWAVFLICDGIRALSLGGKPLSFPFLELFTC